HGLVTTLCMMGRADEGLAVIQNAKVPPWNAWRLEWTKSLVLIKQQKIVEAESTLKNGLGKYENELAHSYFNTYLGFVKLWQEKPEEALLLFEKVTMGEAFVFRLAAVGRILALGKMGKRDDAAKRWKNASQVVGPQMKKILDLLSAKLELSPAGNYMSSIGDRMTIDRELRSESEDLLVVAFSETEP
ncbi:MAG: hypothetical protein AAB576_09485, partial [Elusimicrobiota bacterium]